MVCPPDILSLNKQTSEHEELENTKGMPFNPRKFCQDAISADRQKHQAPVPAVLVERNYVCAATKKFKPSTSQLDFLLSDKMPHVTKKTEANYFVEVVDRHTLNDSRLEYDTKEHEELNARFKKADGDRKMRVGVIFQARQAPGGNNIVDGLLRWANDR